MPDSLPCVVANKAKGYSAVPFRADDGVVATMPVPYTYSRGSIPLKKIQAQAIGSFLAASPSLSQPLSASPSTLPYVALPHGML